MAACDGAAFVHFYQTNTHLLCSLGQEFVCKSQVPICNGSAGAGKGDKFSEKHPCKEQNETQFAFFL